MFRDIQKEIYEAQDVCYKGRHRNVPCDQDECVMKKIYLLDNTGMNVNMSRMHASYRSVATECIKEAQSSSTCEFSGKFIQCFVKRNSDSISKHYDSCQMKYPIDRSGEVPLDMSEESFKKLTNYACLIECNYDTQKLFTENDDFNIDLLRLHSNLPIDVVKEAENCWKQHQQEDKCQRRANRISCLSGKYHGANKNPDLIPFETLVNEIYE